MGVISSQELRKRLFLKDPHKRLVVSPLINLESQMRAGALDVRLGCKFITAKKSKLHSLDPFDQDTRLQIGKAQNEVYVGFGDSFTLHPRQFAIAGSLEYVKMPADVGAYLIGRSSWGRLGLVVATATLIGPGYCGIITFEMVNLGEVPLVLRPGVRVAQMVFHEYKSVESKPYAKSVQGGKYYAATEPDFTRIYEDTDWETQRRIVGVIDDDPSE